MPPSRSYVPPAWAPLEVTLDQATVRIKDQIAVTSIEQEFYNPNPRQLEGTFLFPVPKGAQINKFTMEINGKQVAAELLASDKARGLYEEIVRKLKDPALLEYSERDLFKVRIFPIEPNAKKRITLSYSQVLKSDGGLVNFILPLNTEKFSAKPLKTVSVKVEVETRRPLKSIYSPSHKVEVKRNGSNKATVGYEASDLKPDADFQLFYAQEEGEIGLNLLSYKSAGEDGYFLLLASPGADMKNTRTNPKDVAFVLDTSGSMQGAKIELTGDEDGGRPQNEAGYIGERPAKAERRADRRHAHGRRARAAHHDEGRQDERQERRQLPHRCALDHIACAPVQDAFGRVL
jgi:Ca-activated chloride channel family protein